MRVMTQHAMMDITLECLACVLILSQWSLTMSSVLEFSAIMTIAIAAIVATTIPKSTLGSKRQ